MQTDEKVEQIRRKMSGVRHDLNVGMNGIFENVSELTKLQYYMRQYPWAMMGAATLLGYWIVPQRYEIHSPDAKTLEKLASENKLVVNNRSEPEARGGIVGGLFSFLSTAVMRGAMAYAGAKVGELLDPNSSAKSQAPRNASPRNATGTAASVPHK